jgi:type IV secretory pathway TrbL component
MLAWWRRRRPRIKILIALLPHSLLIETLLVHLVGQAGLVLLVIIERRTRIRPPIRIVETRVSPPISTHASVAVVVAVASAAISPESHTATITAVAAVEAARGECGMRSGASERTRCGTRTRPHTAESWSAGVAGEASTVRSKAADMAATTGGMASAAMLGRKRHGDQQQHERRTEKRSMHTSIICPSEAGQARNLVPAVRRIRTLAGTVTTGKALTVSCSLSLPLVSAYEPASSILQDVSRRAWQQVSQQLSHYVSQVCLEL